MENLQSIVLLIDADNTQLSKMEEVIREISTHGRIVVKRAYGNWKKESLKNWENELKRLAIKAEQQFDYVTGKNATDMALVIDTVNLLHKGIYDAFVIVASDSDYTPLAINLHESGVYVMGVGEKKTPE
ncbi:NYN domain-containing protein, partial [Lentihominibacter sp.]